MNRLVKKWIVPTCLLVMIITQIYNYIQQFRVEPSIFVVILALMPSAIKDLEFNISENIFKIFEKTTIVMAIALLVYTFWSSI